MLIAASLLLSVSVFILIFANQFQVDTDKQPSLQNLSLEILNDDPNNLFWFLQISDIHISKFKDQSRVADFEVFCSVTFEAFQRPKVVIASGDLTDAKDQILGSQQYAEEWKAYRNTLLKTGIVNKTSWLDIRGNHDNFNVQFLYDQSDLFQNFSVQGKDHKRSYLHQEESDGIRYNFLALDASAEPGTKRPYNFIGMIPEDELYRVEKMIRNSPPANYTVWFAHYPTSSIMTSPGFGHIRKFIAKFDESVIFVAGHLHTLAGLSPRMYSLQPEGFLELELGDFMKNRRYRVGVFDHGLFSFADVKLGTWPVAVITNPKDILFNNPFKEDMKLQKHSTHIRILAFSTSEVTLCKVKIDNGQWMTCEKKTKNFFVVPWNPSQFINGKHQMELIVGDKDGRIFNKIQTFALDGSRNQFDFLARFILMSDILTIFQVAFLISFIICLFPLAVFKIWQLLIKYKQVRRPKIASPFWRNLIQKYIIFVGTDRVFYGVFFCLIYTAVGPWSFHEVLDGHVGIFFVWGTFVKGQFIPGTLNWWYGFHQLMFFQLALTVILANVVHRRFKKFMKKHENPITQFNETTMQTLYKNFPFVALITAELVLAIFYLIQNGLLAFIISPMRVWSIVLSLYLFYQAHWKISDESFSNSVLVSIKQATS